VTYRHNWGEHRVYFYDDQSQLKILPADWTDIFPADPFVVVSAGRSLFRLQDLRELAHLLRGMKKGGRR
jgi:hypothetical protein